MTLPEPHRDHDYEALRDLAATVASDVGHEVGARRSAGFSWTTKSSTADVVTEIDTWTEDEVVRRLTAERPGDGFLGEEGTSTPSTTGVTWVIDPIDGTTNLLYDLPGYSVSIAADIDGLSVAGAVYDPIRNELFASALGRGSTRDGEPIHVSNATDLSTSLIGTGFSYLAENRLMQAHQLTSILPAVRDIRRMGGAALDFCAVACGRLDGCYERGLSPWDSAAGSLIASEAGARVLLDGLSVAVAPGIASAFIEVLEQARA